MLFIIAIMIDDEVLQFAEEIQKVVPHLLLAFLVFGQEIFEVGRFAVLFLDQNAEKKVQAAGRVSLDVKIYLGFDLGKTVFLSYEGLAGNENLGLVLDPDQFIKVP